MEITKPEVDYPEGTPPKALEITDIWEGDGKVAGAGDTVEVHYVGVSYSTGEEFDASWNTGQAFQLALGSGQVIQGWEQGLIGMKPGGRRLLVIPPDLGYGASGSPPKIKPNETLLFVIDRRQ